MPDPGKTPARPAEPRQREARPQGAQVYQLKRPLAELPDNLRLRNHEWGVLFAVTGEHSCAQIATLLGLTPEERDRTFGRLAAFGLLEERPLSYGEYLRALASWRDDEPRPMAAFLRGGAAMPHSRTMPPAPALQPAAPLASGARVVTAPIPPVGRRPDPPAAPPIVTADSDLNITRALPTRDRRQVTAAAAEEPPLPAFLPLEPIAPPPASAPRPARKTLSLKTLMQLILGRAGDPQSGQLDVYRVFIRVNTKLLQRNGITTLRFQEDRLIEDPELQHALVASFEKALGVPCPPEVFVGGAA